MRDFQQLEWNDVLEDDCRQLIRLATREDLDRWHDWTTVALVPLDAQGSAAVVARQAGRICGLRAARLTLQTMDYQTVWQAELDDGAAVAAGTHLATIQGRARTLLTAERTLLNFLGHLSGVATLTAEYVAAVAGTRARVYDTRKTTPGWRRLEKYAVRSGGGHNHRTGLFDAILIKDNHLALGHQTDGGHFTPAEAVQRARHFCQQAAAAGDPRSSLLVEVEVDSLEQLEQVLPVGPDIVLLDNMSPERLSAAVRRRDALGVPVELEASGGVTLTTVRQIAETGVDRISVGALTHSAVSLDVGLDWQS
ncbi:MAG TPA: carboxylating nicotinate-nucleotide diphosphorylase [Pirellulales bacterium]|jgi:nicotinate-nucleotide pyrophosphorylase (carboxylating)|nr:carboxylating nicotinate-nucleotide diphosphorylase [Pirellulales bacterium]